MRGIDFYTDHLTGEAMYRFKGELVAYDHTFGYPEKLSVQI